MKNKEDKNVCIRIDRDEIQINRCKEQLNDMNDFILDYAQALQLAGNEVRMKILILLREEEKLCVCDLSEILEMKIPAVSQHLRKMKDAGLVITEREGTTIYYFIKPGSRRIISSILKWVVDKAEAGV